MTPHPPPKKKYPQNHLKTPQNIEIQNFDPKKIARAYGCMKISEYPHPLGGKRTDGCMMENLPSSQI